jgi:hypothetical protein
MRGLRVVRLLEELPDIQSAEMLVARDAASGPWAGAADAARAEELLVAHGRDWKNLDLLSVVGDCRHVSLQAVGVSYRRGFLHHVGLRELDLLHDRARYTDEGLRLDTEAAREHGPDTFAGRLFRAAPLESVALEDRQPDTELTRGGESCWFWERFGGEMAPGPHVLRPCLYDLLRTRPDHQHANQPPHDEADPTGVRLHNPPRTAYLTPGPGHRCRVPGSRPAGAAAGLGQGSGVIAFTSCLPGVCSEDRPHPQEDDR